MPISSRESIRAEAPAEVVSVGIVACALGLIQVLIGGTRLIFSLPVYGLLAIVGLMSAMSLRTPKPQPAKLCLASSAIFFGYILTRARSRFHRRNSISGWAKLYAHFILAAIRLRAQSEWFLCLP